MRILSFITDPPVVKKILGHLDSYLEGPGTDSARGPPGLELEPSVLVS